MLIISVTAIVLLFVVAYLGVLLCQSNDEFRQLLKAKRTELELFQQERQSFITRINDLETLYKDAKNKLQVIANQNRGRRING